MCGFEVLIGRLLNDRFVLNVEKENKIMVILFPNILIIYRAIIGSLCTVDDGATYRSNGLYVKTS